MEELSFKATFKFLNRHKKVLIITFLASAIVASGISLLLPNYYKSQVTLLPSDTVKILCNTLQERCLSVLAYLLKTYIQHGSQACEVNLEVIKGYVGLSKTNRGSNNEIIRDIFLVLSKLGLIKFKAEKALDQTTGGYRTRYILEEVNNKVDFFE